MKRPSSSLTPPTSPATTLRGGRGDGRAAGGEANGGASLLNMMRCAKPAKVGSLDQSRDPRLISDMKAIKICKALMAKASKDNGEFMVVRDFNIRVAAPGSNVAVVLGCDPDDKNLRFSKNRLLPVFGIAKFIGNVALTKDNFSSFGAVHGYSSFDESVCNIKKGKHPIGWHFGSFELFTDGILLVPSSSGSQD